MNQKTKETWLIPIITNLGGGFVLGFIFLYLNAWATGIPLRAPFTFGWMKSVLEMRLPLWAVLLFGTSTAIATLYVRDYVRSRSGVTTESDAAVLPFSEAAHGPRSEESAAGEQPGISGFPKDGDDGSHRETARYILCGQDQLTAYTTTRDGLPGSRFLVVRARPNQQPQSLETSDQNAANAKWSEWYLEWKKQGFGGASGTGLDGTSPFE